MYARRAIEREEETLSLKSRQENNEIQMVLKA